MATKLKNLKIKKVDFVDNGANPGASIALYKSKPAEGKTPAVQPKEDTPPEESILKRIVHAIAKSIGATDAQAAAAVEEVSKTRTSPPLATLWPAAGCARPRKKSGITVRPE